MKAGVLLIVLVGAHIALGVVRLPGKVWFRRLDEVDSYNRLGAPRYLLGSAKLDGADELEWLLSNTPEDCVVLWRWPSDGALEFAAALLAPRLVVDERDVMPDAERYLDRLIARTDEGQIVLQGTDGRGLRRFTR